MLQPQQQQQINSKSSTNLKTHFQISKIKSGRTVERNLLFWIRPRKSKKRIMWVYLFIFFSFCVTVI
ncbi:unnamed protein product [Meloidogyne enterolobii]|uniref:Uncharacterized protein n=1 Tax=Meloidogyne enterolobii TaxID=390850 RepID=A0ACB0YZM3_MELEN